MKSPFPGMDPYLVPYWTEVHASFIVYARNQLNQRLPDGLRAGVEQALTVEVDGEWTRSIRPDVHVGMSPKDDEGPGSQAVSVAEPLKIRMPPRPQRHIEITDSAGHVITAIEFLSPANKVSEKGRTQYFRKQMEYLSSGTNLVEIDLVRQGAYVLAAPEEEIPSHHRTPYMISVYRGHDPDVVEVYRAPLQEPLPNISIPLRPNEVDVALELQPLIDACYHDGRYKINYREAPRPPLSADDERWADELLREAQCR